MNSTLQATVNSLEHLSNSITNSSSEDRLFNEIWGWNYPSLSRHDLAEIPRKIAEKINSINYKEIDNELESQIESIPHRINSFITNSLPYLYNGSANMVVPLYFSLIEWVNSKLEPLFSWEVLLDNKALPKELARRIRNIQATLNDIEPNKDELSDKISLINKATETAENLPTDLETLKEAKKNIDTYNSEAQTSSDTIKKLKLEIEGYKTEILAKKNEADQLVAKCEEAYKITTTKGLAAAFDQRAKSLTWSMWYWVIGLLLTLTGSMFVGANRFDTLNKAIEVGKEPTYVWIQVIISVISFGAPIWFAWIATKQIGQRFKLAEDYAYKASVAKAYEGYKGEAAKIDKEFEKRVFGSALSRLEEAPLRLMEKEHYGSPWHEILSSEKLQEAIDKTPELKNMLLDALKIKKNKQSSEIEVMEESQSIPFTNN